ncbi:hypothetical protein BDR06DRAFT_967541 [Suillus hirtellus]|nr:hypothetical protein BDR06DRAFT_967541 [Suillus hirtellus]
MCPPEPQQVLKLHHLHLKHASLPRDPEYEHRTHLLGPEWWQWVWYQRAGISILKDVVQFNPSGGHAAGLSHLYDIADAIGSMKINDTEDLEANLSLADCVVRELELMASLSKFKSSLSKQKLDRADVGLGYMRIAFKTHGLSHCVHHLHGSVVEVGDHDGHEITIQLD